jgi:hypothetical protein
VLVSYGELANEQLLASFGFVLDGNPHDRFRFAAGAAELMELAADGLPGPVAVPSLAAWQVWWPADWRCACDHLSPLGDRVQPIWQTCPIAWDRRV